MHLLPFILGSLVRVTTIKGVLHIALESDARPTVVQGEDRILVPAVMHHPDDLDGTFLDVWSTVPRCMNAGT